MTDETLLGLFNLSIAIGICILLVYARKKKKITITRITDPVTTIHLVVISGKGITILTIGWGIIIILLSISGLRSLLQLQTLEETFLVTSVCFMLIFITTETASYFSPKLKK